MQALTREITDRAAVRAAAQRLSAVEQPSPLAVELAGLLAAVADAWQASDRASTVGEVGRWSPVCECATRIAGHVTGARS